MRKKKLKQLKKQANLSYLVGVFLMVWMLSLTIIMHQEVKVEIVEKTKYSDHEQKVLELVEKEYKHKDCQYYIKTKNYDGTYTIAVTKNDEVNIICYYVVNPENKTIAYYGN